jgi:hypothetical protein
MITPAIKKSFAVGIILLFFLMVFPIQTIPTLEVTDPTVINERKKVIDSCTDVDEITYEYQSRPNIKINFSADSQISFPWLEDQYRKMIK